MTSSPVGSLRDDSAALQEIGALEADLERKHARYSDGRGVAGEISRSSLTNDEKLKLAIRTSNATVPGAFRSDGDSELDIKSPQIAEIARLRDEQKRRDAAPADTGNACLPNDYEIIGELQSRMQVFQAEVVAEDKEQKAELRDRRKRENRWMLVVAILLVVVIAGAIVGVVVGVILPGGGR